jgi:hypothetical protein
MQQMKLKDLYKACQKLMKEGKGEKTLILSDDNEGNGYHGMFYTLTEISDEDAKYYQGCVYDTNEEEVTNCIVVG